MPKSNKRIGDNEMTDAKPIHRIAIVGTGVIGASRSAEYLARGFDVVATDPAPNAESNLRKLIDEAWKDLTSMKTLAYGGSSMAPELIRPFEGRIPRPLEFYD